MTRPGEKLVLVDGPFDGCQGNVVYLPAHVWAFEWQSQTMIVDDELLLAVEDQLGSVEPARYEKQGEPDDDGRQPYVYGMMLDPLAALGVGDLVAA